MHLYLLDIARKTPFYDLKMSMLFKCNKRDYLYKSLVFATFALNDLLIIVVNVRK